MHPMNKQPTTESEIDSLTAEDLMTLAYLNSLPDENGVRPIDRALLLIDKPPPGSRQRTGAGDSPAATGSSPQPATDKTRKDVKPS